MVLQLVPLTLGEVLEACIDDSRKEWLKSNKAGREDEYAWSTDVITTSLDVKLSHMGRAEVTVTIVTKQRWKRESYFFRCLRAGPSSWVRLGDSLNIK